MRRHHHQLLLPKYIANHKFVKFSSFFFHHSIWVWLEIWSACVFVCVVYDASRHPPVTAFRVVVEVQFQSNRWCVWISRCSFTVKKLSLHLSYLLNSCVGRHCVLVPEHRTYGLRIQVLQPSDARTYSKVLFMRKWNCAYHLIGWPWRHVG